MKKRSKLRKLIRKIRPKRTKLMRSNSQSERTRTSKTQSNQRLKKTTRRRTKERAGNKTEVAAGKNIQRIKNLMIIVYDLFSILPI